MFASKMLFVKEEVAVLTQHLYSIVYYTPEYIVTLQYTKIKIYIWNSFSFIGNFLSSKCPQTSVN